MKKILEYLRLVLFVGGVLIGVQVPGFVDQYGKRLESHLLESKLSLKEFQQDADKYFAGDIQRLIAHYKKNNDPIVADGGVSIQNVFLRNRALAQAMDRFNDSSYSPYLEAIVKPINEIRTETWNSYTFNIMLDSSAITWGLFTGFILAVVIELVVFLFAAVFKPRRRSRSPQYSRRR